MLGPEQAAGQYLFRPILHNFMSAIFAAPINFGLCSTSCVVARESTLKRSLSSLLRADRPGIDGNPGIHDLAVDDAVHVQTRLLERFIGGVRLKNWPVCTPVSRH